MKKYLILLTGLSVGFVYNLTTAYADSISDKSVTSVYVVNNDPNNNFAAYKPYTATLDKTATGVVTMDSNDDIISDTSAVNNEISVEDNKGKLALIDYRTFQWKLKCQPGSALKKVYYYTVTNFPADPDNPGTSYRNNVTYLCLNAPDTKYCVNQSFAIDCN